MTIAGDPVASEDHLLTHVENSQFMSPQSVRFITSGTVKTEAEATAKLIVGLVPTFNPSFKLINKKRIYDLLPDKITLVKYNGTVSADNTVPEDSSSEVTDPGTSEGGGDDLGQ